MTSDELIEVVRNITGAGNNKQKGTADEDLLGHLSDVMLEKLVPDVIRLREEYFVRTVRISASSATKLRFPTRAIGVRGRDICWWDGSARVPLQLIPREKLPFFVSTMGTAPSGFYLEGNYVCLVPDGTVYSGYLELAVFLRPGRLVKEEDARQVIGITSGHELTLDADMPSSWTTGTLLDFHSPESGAELKAWDIPIDERAGGASLALDLEVDGSSFGTFPVAVGDWVVPAGFAVVPGLPVEMHRGLAETAALEVAKGLNDQPAIAVHAAESRLYAEKAKSILNNRMEAKPMRITGARGVLHAR